MSESKPQVCKTTFVLTVLHPAEDNPVSYDLEDVAREIDSGLWIGNVEHVSTVAVPREQVEAELTAIGNDGGFFDEYFEGDGTDEEGAEDGTSGQDRESYSDEQDRDSYTVED